MIRQIIRIDQEKCTGCGLCATACHEGAIDMVDGKAHLVREHFCDGLGDCLPVCPTGAITFEEREALPYDKEAAEANIRQRQAQAPLRPVILAEGSYCCHPDLWGCYDLHVFVTAPLDVRLARLARRPGVDLAAFRTRWIPLEEAYFAAERLEERCDILVKS